MNTKMILFDLDGTLLPMDQDEFTKGYFSLLVEKMSPYGYEPEKLINAVWKGTAAMVVNTGEQSNEECFWEKFFQAFGQKVLSDKLLFDEFYKEDFQRAKAYCGYNENAVKTVSEIKKAGFRTALATNPIFPAIATESRIVWAGFDPSDFELYTTYENTSYCKPNPDYYRNICKRLGVLPEECLMVGNDVTEDMVAQSIGMKVFLLTDCLINKNRQDISGYPKGDFEDLLNFIKHNSEKISK